MRLKLLGLASLGALLNAALLLVPSILLGFPSLVLEDRSLAAFILIVSLWLLLEFFVSTTHQDLQSSSGFLANLMTAAVLALFLVSLTEQALKGLRAFSMISLLGLILMAIGIGLRLAAIRALAAYFFDAVIVVSGQSLMTSGIYHYIRHPSELGNLCIAFGSPLLLGSTNGLILSSLLLLPIVLIRICFEDKLLRQHYPEQFSDYARDVPALVSPKTIMRFLKQS